MQQKMANTTLKKLKVVPPLWLQNHNCPISVSNKFSSAKPTNYKMKWLLIGLQWNPLIVDPPEMRTPRYSGHSQNASLILQHVPEMGTPL